MSQHNSLSLRRNVFCPPWPTIVYPDLTHYNCCAQPNYTRERPTTLDTSGEVYLLEPGGFGDLLFPVAEKRVKSGQFYYENWKPGKALARSQYISPSRDSAKISQEAPQGFHLSLLQAEIPKNHHNVILQSLYRHRLISVQYTRENHN